MVGRGNANGLHYGYFLLNTYFDFKGCLQVWCEISTPEALLGQVLGDPHSPGKFRVVSDFKKKKKEEKKEEKNPTLPENSEW